MKLTIDILESHKKDVETVIDSYEVQLEAQEKRMESTKKDIENRKKQLHELNNSISFFKQFLELSKKEE